jgi:glycerophosphoryl diester phosphodiesterase
MSFSLLAVLRLKRDLDDVVYVIAHRWRLLYLPTNKVAINLELFERSRWTRKRLKGREVLIWTVNEERYIPKLKEWGVSAVITDRPDLPFRLS